MLCKSVVYNFCKGKATGCSYFPPQYATIGWVRPTMCTVGRYNEPGDWPPSVIFVILETCISLITAAIFVVCKMCKRLEKRKVWCCKRRQKVWNGPLGLKTEASPGQGSREKFGRDEVGVFCCQSVTNLELSLDRWIDKLFGFSPQPKTSRRSREQELCLILP